MDSNEGKNAPDVSFIIVFVVSLVLVLNHRTLLKICTLHFKEYAPKDNLPDEYSPTVPTSTRVYC